MLQTTGQTKALHWQKIATGQDTIWANFMSSDAAFIDQAELEAMFGKTETKVALERMGGGSGGGSGGQARVLDGRRANNVGIILSQFRGTAYADICRHMMTASDDGYTPEQLSQLLFCLPNADDLTALQRAGLWVPRSGVVAGAGGDGAVDEAVSFMLETLRHPGLDFVIENHLFRRSFGAGADDVREGVARVSLAAHETKTSPSFASILEMTLGAPRALGRVGGGGVCVCVCVVGLAWGVALGRDVQLVWL